jgi:hypothetical protein
VNVCDDLPECTVSHFRRTIIAKCDYQDRGSGNSLHHNTEQQCNPPDWYSWFRENLHFVLFCSLVCVSLFSWRHCLRSIIYGYCLLKLLTFNRNRSWSIFRQNRYFVFWGRDIFINQTPTYDGRALKYRIWIKFVQLFRSYRGAHTHRRHPKTTFLI